MKKKFFLKLLFLFTIFFLYTSAYSPLYSETIKIGQSLPVTGNMSAAANQFQKGASAWIQFINSRGGINNNLIELITKDDSGDPKKALKNTEFFILENFFMIYGYMGSESCIESFKLSEKSKIPFFGASTGAQELHSKGGSIFFMRPDYASETQTMIEILLNHQKNKIALFNSDSKWAQSFANEAEKNFKKNQIENYTFASSPKDNAKLTKAAEKINSISPDALIIAAEPDLAALLIKEIRKINPSIIIMASSEINGENLSGNLMNQGIGVIVSQVVPFPFYTKLPVTQLYKRVSSEYFPEEPLSFYGLEGFISARAMTTILNECKELTRENFIKTARNMKSVNLGGFVFDFTENKSTGSLSIYFSQIGPGGFLTPITSLDDIYKYNAL
jgi:ABC-type branched-subunit amino acid transport system substrate-binding protein